MEYVPEAVDYVNSSFFESNAFADGPHQPAALRPHLAALREGYARARAAQLRPVEFSFNPTRPGPQESNGGITPGYNGPRHDDGEPADTTRGEVRELTQAAREFRRLLGICEERLEAHDAEFVEIDRAAANGFSSLSARLAAVEGGAA